MNTAIVITIIACLIIIASCNIAYAIGKRHASVSVISGVEGDGNVISQSGGNADYYEDLIEEAYVPHVVSCDTAKTQLKGVKKQLAEQIGNECLRKGLIRFSRKDNDWTSPSHIIYDKITARISVRK